MNAFTFRNFVGMTIVAAADHPVFADGVVLTLRPPGSRSRRYVEVFVSPKGCLIVGELREGCQTLRQVAS